MNTNSESDFEKWLSKFISGNEPLTSALEAAWDEQQKEIDRLREALEKYADPMNWGYIDDSGCSKGRGEYEDACFLGTEVARSALTTKKEKQG